MSGAGADATAGRDRVSGVVTPDDGPMPALPQLTPGGWGRFIPARGWWLAEWALRSSPGRFGYGYLIAHRSGDVAAAMAFRIQTSLLPLVGAALAVVGLVLRDDDAAAALERAVAALFPAGDSLGVATLLSDASEQAAALGFISLAGLLWLGTSLLEHLERAFNRFYGVAPRDPIGARLRATGLILVVGVLLVLTVVVSGLLTALATLAERLLGTNRLTARWGTVEELSALGAGFVLALGLFLVLYWPLPNARLRLRDVWVGAALAALLLVALNRLFPLFVRLAPSQATSAVLTFLILLTSWVFLVAHVVLIGAALNAFLYRHRTAAAGRTESSPWDGAQLAPRTTVPRDQEPQRG